MCNASPKEHLPHWIEYISCRGNEFSKFRKLRNHEGGRQNYRRMKYISPRFYKIFVVTGYDPAQVQLWLSNPESATGINVNINRLSLKALPRYDAYSERQAQKFGIILTYLIRSFQLSFPIHGG
jgi:hypothetical protein